MSSPIHAFGITINRLTMEHAGKIVLQWMLEDYSHCHYIVTPNVDHIVNLQKNKNFFDAYQDADLVLLDGKPVFYALKLLGRNPYPVIPGSDFVPYLFSISVKLIDKIKVFWLGASPGVAKRAAHKTSAMFSHVNNVGVYSPPLGFETDPQENKKILQLIGEATPDLLILGLGAPKQEIWVHRYKNALKTKVAICAGATIDFIAGKKKRAPLWMRKLALEWLHRLLTEPLRLSPRYLYDALLFPQVLYQQWLIDNNKLSRGRQLPPP